MSHLTPEIALPILMAATPPHERAVFISDRPGMVEVVYWRTRGTQQRLDWDMKRCVGVFSKKNNKTQTLTALKIAAQTTSQAD